MKLYRIDKDHVAELRESIKDHDFFGGIKGRRRNGKVESGCGHARIEAAREAGLESIPIFIDDIDDDAMLRLMTDENAIQGGTNPGAIMNEVAAVIRRLIEGLLRVPQQPVEAPASIKAAFESVLAMKQTIGKLRAGKDVHTALGEPTISRYLSQGHPEKSHRGARQIRTAISALKQSGRYDDIVEEMVRRYPEPVADKDWPVAWPRSAAAKTIAKDGRPPRRAPVLDDRCANLFPNEHQFDAFREAVTTRAAQQVIPVDQQYALAKQIIDGHHAGKKQAGAPYIKTMVQAAVQDGMKKQRQINKEERELYLHEQREARIDDELHSANAAVRGLIVAIAKLNELSDEFPCHPKIGGFSARLDTLVRVIQQLSKKINPAKL